MIPVRLKLSNFMPYGEGVPELSFAGVHTAVISGDNGAGKSSIIDAITWALWGKARARSDDELIHQGAAEMEVEFDFTVGGQLYRIIRKHTRARTRRVSGKGSLDFFIAGERGFIPLSAETKTATEEKIAALLHMDYDTFVNSAFLRQGHADEFSRQTPAKRKEVLGRILGLDAYDEYEARAKGVAKAAADERLRLGLNISDMELDLAQQPACEDEFRQAEAELKTCSEALSASEARLAAVRQQHKELAAVRAHADQLAETLRRHEEDLLRWEEQRGQVTAHLQEYRALAAQEGAVKAGYQGFTQAKQRLSELERRARELYQLKEKRAQLEKAYLQAQSELTVRCKVAGERVAQLEERVARQGELRREFLALQPRQKELADLNSFLSARRQQAQEASQLLARLQAEIARTRQAVAAAQDKLALLAASDGGAHCPLCETELGQERLGLVRGKYEAEQQQDEAHIAELEAGVARGHRQTAELDREIAIVEARLKDENNNLVSQVSRLNQLMKEANEAQSQLQGERAALAELEEQLASKDFARTELTALARVDAVIAQLDYQEAAHEAARAELTRLEPYEEQMRRLEEALQRIPQEEEKLARTAQAVRDIQTRRERDRATRDGLVGRLAELPVLEGELAQAEASYNTQLSAQRALQERLGSLKQKLSYLKDLASKIREKGKQLAAAAHREAVYLQLAEAFGKKGIQAMLIETALPEIEDEANRLLARMTDNRMSVAFETQRETKKGEVSETLDIKIADELGTRDYELFSGGEAFRIDFAIRIALSKLLARRAGAPLPTLIIDEGFGTQDAEGIEKLKEAINSVQGDFKLIIVITHIEELKDAFPTRLNVAKAEGGSTIEVS